MRRVESRKRMPGTTLSRSANRLRWAMDHPLTMCIVLLLTALSLFLLVPGSPRYVGSLASGSRGDDAVVFLSIGDYGTASVAQKEVAVQMAATASAEGAKFVLTVGDNVYDRGVKDLEDPLFNEVFESIYTQPSLQIPWHMALGDHDHRGSVAAQVAHSHRSFKWQMPAPYYSFKFAVGEQKDMEVVVTDSIGLEGVVAYPNNDTDRRFVADYNLTVCGQEAGKRQLKWLEQVLEQSTSQWLVVIGHRPIITAAERPRFPAESRFSNMLRGLLQRYSVDLYLFGHDHVGQHLEDGGGVVYVGNGVGGYGTHPTARTNETVWVNGNFNGFLLHKVTSATMDLTFIDSHGSHLHSLQLKPKQRQRSSIGWRKRK